MQALKYLVLALALVQGGWFAFDGMRAFVTGDYVTPRNGPGAGQLGPWSRIVGALGLDPRGTLVKTAHVLLGLAWLVSLACFAMRPSLGWGMLLGCAAMSLWYLPIGTFIGIAEIVLLLLIRK